jgi:hydroxyacylglutathione hydrolase
MQMPSVTIYGGRGDNAEGVEIEVFHAPLLLNPYGQADLAIMQVDESFQFQLGGVAITALSTPCHTPGHVTYVASCDGQPKAAFTGDT